MKKLRALLALSLGPCLATNIGSCPYTINTGGSYYVTTNLTTTGSTCITIASSTTAVDLNLQGYTVTAVDDPITVTGNSGSVIYHDGTVKATNTNGGAFHISNNTGTVTSQYINYTQTNTANLYGQMDVHGNSHVIFNGDYLYATSLYSDTSALVQFYSGTIDITPTHQYVAGAATFNLGLTDAFLIDNSAVYGNSPNKVVQYSGGVPFGTDDVVLPICAAAPYTCAGSWAVTNSTIKNGYDSGIEIVGNFQYVGMTHITFQNVPNGFICYANSIGCNMDTFNFNYNSLAKTSSTDKLFYFFSPASGNYLTNGNFIGNTVSGSGSSDYIAIENHTGTTISGLTFTNNVLTGNTVLFQNSGGVTDGGGNYCTSATNPLITCH